MHHLTAVWKQVVISYSYCPFVLKTDLNNHKDIFITSAAYYLKGHLLFINKKNDIIMGEYYHIYGEKVV